MKICGHPDDCPCCPCPVDRGQSHEEIVYEFMVNTGVGRPDATQTVERMTRYTNRQRPSFSVIKREWKPNISIDADVMNDPVWSKTAESIRERMVEQDRRFIEKLWRNDWPVLTVPVAPKTVEVGRAGDPFETATIHGRAAISDLVANCPEVPGVVGAVEQEAISESGQDSQSSAARSS